MDNIDSSLKKKQVNIIFDDKNKEVMDSKEIIITYLQYHSSVLLT